MVCQVRVSELTTTIHNGTGCCQECETVALAMLDKPGSDDVLDKEIYITVFAERCSQIMAKEDDGEIIPYFVKDKRGNTTFSSKQRQLRIKKHPAKKEGIAAAYIKEPSTDTTKLSTKQKVQHLLYDCKTHWMTIFGVWYGLGALLAIVHSLWQKA